MFESEAEMRELQALLDRSLGNSGVHMGHIVTPEHRLTAGQLVAYLQDVKHVSFGTVTAKGEPFVSPLDSFFIHGRFWVSTSGTAVKARHVVRQAAVSLCHVVRDDIGIWVHGRARILRKDDGEVADYDRIATRVYGSSPFGWEEDIIVMPVEPRAMFAYAQHPGSFPAEVAPASGG
jgi:hypothetical protein